MTWFRVGGAGIPASLKNAMNAVLNKKFGTSGQNYPPKQWPDDVNLLGPLPVKTASGVTVTFADGADDVPIASASFGIIPSGGGGTPGSPVPIVGYSDMTITHTDGQTPPVESKTISDTFGRTIYGGTRALDGTLSEKGFLNVFDDVETNTISSQCYSFNKVNGVVATLGNTVRISFTVKTANNINRISNTYAAQKCNVAPHSFSYSGDTEHFYINTVLYLFIDKTICGETAESVYNWLVALNTNGTPLTVYMEYTNANTYAIDPLPINSYYGDNKIYTDITGATNSVSYRADINLALQGSRSLSASMMRSAGADLEERSEDTEEVSELEENIQNTEEQEGENDER